jgi:predicted PurR-regulated permease PerM/methylmalonyl-CoA mutase cobalamin-binding subunit
VLETGVASAMAPTKQNTSSALVAMAGVVITTFVFTALYVGREILVPLALAALLTFLLTPIVSWIERFLGRIAAVLVAVAVLCSVVFGIGWVLTHEMLDLATRLPGYKENIQKKLRSLHMPAGGRFAEFNKAVAELQEDIPGNTPAAASPVPASAASKSTPPVTPVTKPAAVAPLPVIIVDSKQANPLEQFGRVVAPMLGPLGTAALVLLLLVCMLLQREDLRGRIIRLLGLGNISATTRGLDDAAGRVARYLLMQLIVNATYGVAVGVGLYFIGVPSAFVWGVLATVLRFIPYVGPWIAAAFPVALSLAVSDTWTLPLLTVGLFVVLELLSNNVMEPWLYGASTGVSPIALIIAAVFWTWLWGAPGLVLATPLTVCLVVIGRHVPRLGVLSVLLSNEDALSPREELYHRLLTPNADDAADFATAWVKANSLLEFYDRVCIPALADVERDCKSGQLEDQQHSEILQEVRDVIEDLGLQPIVAPESGPADAGAIPNHSRLASTCRVVVLPVRADRDEIAGAMLTQLLLQQGIAAENLTAERTTGELLEIAMQEPADAFCISVMRPSTVIHARYLCGKLRAKLPKSRIVVAMWGAAEEITEIKDRLRASGADELVSTLPEALALLTRIAAARAAVENTTRELPQPRQ